MLLKEDSTVENVLVNKFRKRHKESAFCTSYLIYLLDAYLLFKVQKGTEMYLFYLEIYFRASLV